MEPAWDLPRPNVTKPDRSKVKFSKLSGMLGTTPLEGNNIIWGSLWVFGGSQGGLKGSFWAFSDILRNFILAEFFSQHLCTFGCCPFGSWLSIHISSQDLSFIDFADTCLFYHRRLKVNIGKSEIDQKGDYGAIFFSAPIHIWNLFFWLRGLYPYNISGFEFR